MTKADAIAVLFDEAERCGVSPPILKSAAGELIALRLRIIELERAIDRRAVSAMENTAKVAALAAKGLKAVAIAKRTGIPLPTVYRHLKKIPTA